MAWPTSKRRTWLDGAIRSVGAVGDGHRDSSQAGDDAGAGRAVQAVGAVHGGWDAQGECEGTRAAQTEARGRSAGLARTAGRIGRSWRSHTASAPPNSHEALAPARCAVPDTTSAGLSPVPDAASADPSHKQRRL